jgi:hypothetical protein
MSPTLIACVLLGCGQADLSASARSGSPRAAPPPYYALQAELSQLLKREAQAQSPAERARAVAALCDLHQRLVRDPRYAKSDTLKEYRARLWSRLSRIKLELKQRLARDRTNREALEDLAALEQADLASVAAADAVAASLSLLDQAQGGPGALLSYGGAAVPGDYGPELVDLIERTINPSFWDVAGGPGTIVYYRPLQCLVVRATAEVHGQVGGVLGELRAAGK